MEQMATIGIAATYRWIVNTPEIEAAIVEPDEGEPLDHLIIHGGWQSTICENIAFFINLRHRIHEDPSLGREEIQRTIARRMPFGLKSHTGSSAAIGIRVQATLTELVLMTTPSLWPAPDDLREEALSKSFSLKNLERTYGRMEMEISRMRGTIPMVEDGAQEFRYAKRLKEQTQAKLDELKGQLPTRDLFDFGPGRDSWKFILEELIFDNQIDISELYRTIIQTDAEPIIVQRYWISLDLTDWTKDLVKSLDRIYKFRHGLFDEEDQERERIAEAQFEPPIMPRPETHPEEEEQEDPQREEEQDAEPPMVETEPVSEQQLIESARATGIADMYQALIHDPEQISSLLVESENPIELVTKLSHWRTTVGRNTAFFINLRELARKIPLPPDEIEGAITCYMTSPNQDTEDVFTRQDREAASLVELVLMSHPRFLDIIQHTSPHPIDDQQHTGSPPTEQCCNPITNTHYQFHTPL